MEKMVISLQHATLFVVALSFATERLTEIFRAIFCQSWAEKLTDIKAEAQRQAKIQGLAVFSGMLVSGLSYPITYDFFDVFIKEGLPKGLQIVLIIVALGLLASGGSGVWNSILGYILKLKNGA